MIKNYYKTSSKFDDMVSAIAAQIERGTDHQGEEKWDKGVVLLHTDENHYEIRLTDPCDEFEDGCVLIVGGPKDRNLSDLGMIGEGWWAYDNFFDETAEGLLSYVNSYEGENWDWLDRARLSSPRYGMPNRIWISK